MSYLMIEGGRPLHGRITVQCAKNSVLPILAATLLAGDVCRITACPRLSDVDTASDILRHLGCAVCWEGSDLVVDTTHITRCDIPEALMRKMRSSVIFLGAILSRCSQAELSYPGGCELGPRPIDLHLSGLRQLGVQMEEEGGVIRCDGRNMHPATVHFDYPSVGATENVMMAAALLRGETVLNNVAREPEILDLQRFLNAMGAKITGAGTNSIRVQGVSRLTCVEYRPMPDRIAAGTLLAAAAVTGGSVRLRNVPVEEMLAVIAKLEEMGCVISRQENSLTLHGPERLSAFAQLQTQPHPGFPTDMQAQVCVCMALASGVSRLTENVYETRFFGYCTELENMGADILISGKTAIVTGKDRLHGATVEAHDLRAGAALVIAGLAAEGQTVVEKIHFIERGYENIVGKLTALGADIRRTEE